MDTLTIDLFGSGMGPLHRAGLGGLACTLKQLDWPSDQWGIEDEGRKLKLSWPGGDKGARPFFQRLYEQAFDVKDGLIELPGAYATGVRLEVKAEFQRGMSATILQFAPNRKARSKEPKIVKCEVDEHPLLVEHQDLVSYTHRTAWSNDLLNSQGVLKPIVTVSGTIAPGFSQRHVAHASTSVDVPVGHAISLHFALVGTLSFTISGGGGSGALIIPDVQDLRSFIRRRPLMNPKDLKDCRISNPAEGALEAQVRLQSIEAGLSSKVERCLAIRFASTQWNSKQKGRVSVLDVDPKGSELDLYHKVIGFEALKPRVIEVKAEKKGDRPRKVLVNGILRGFIAENLAHHRPWYQGFRNLMVGSDGRHDKNKLGRLGFEREGLRQMVELPWEDRGEETLVLAIHEAMRQQFGKLWDEVKKDKTTFGNRRSRKLERWHLALAHAKTADDVRGAISDIWGRAGQVPKLMESWRELLPILCDSKRWQLNRDLAILALASYKGRETPENPDGAGGESEANSNESQD